MAVNGGMNHVVCLYEESGLSADAWARAGYQVHCYDLLNDGRIEACGKGWKIFHRWDANDLIHVSGIIERHRGKTVMGMGFPPCTDLAASGAKHFYLKRYRDPLFQDKAMDLVYTARNIFIELACPWVIENPVGVVSSMWRKPDHIFNPWEYGGYLPEDDVHPFYPEYIAPRDAYPKKTCYWTGGNFIMPEPKPVPVPPGYSAQFKFLGGKSAKTKRIRSMSPRGIAQAIYEVNRPWGDPCIA